MAHPFRYRCSPIRLGEFDLGGVLYHARYFHLFEDAREGFLRSHDLPYSYFIEQGQHLAIVEAHQSFDAPVRYGDEVEIDLWFSELRRSSLKVCYSLFIPARSESPIHHAWTRHALVQNGPEGFRPAKIGNPLDELVRRYLID